MFEVFQKINLFFIFHFFYILFFFAGSKFLASILVAPVKNEHGDIIMFIINFEDITDAPSKTEFKNFKISK